MAATEAWPAVSAASLLANSPAHGVQVVLTREDLLASGHVSLADILRRHRFNSFGSFSERSGSSARSQARLDLRGLGSERTLVLINGRRVPGSPLTGSRGADLNLLPLAIVERVEILSGAAAGLHGTDAIGGAVNIVLRDDLVGAELGLGANRPSQPGADAEQGAFVLGARHDRGRFLISAEVFRREPIFDRDRSWSRAFDPGTGNIADTRGISQAGNTIIPLAPLPGTLFQWVPAPNCPPEVYAGVFDIPQGQACAYDFASQAMMTASLNRQNMFVTADYELNADHRLYFQQSVARLKSQGRLAPVVSQFRVAADNPNNPFPGTPMFLQHRLVALGNRDGLQTNTVMDSLLGLAGRLGAVDYDLSIRHNRYESSEFGAAHALASIVSQLVASGAYDPFDPFSPANADAIAQMSHAIHRDVRGRYIDSSLILSGDAGSLRWAAGTEYRSESLTDSFDLQSQAGNVLGAGTGADIRGSRDAWSVFTEWLIPLHETFGLTVAGRYDDFEKGGSRFSPQASLYWQPLPIFKLHGGWGRGLRVADLGTQFLPGDQTVVTPVSPFPGPPVTVTTGPNPDLAPERSEHLHLGLNLEPLDNLRLRAELYRIEVDRVIVLPTLQMLVNLDQEGFGLPAGTGITRNDAGQIIAADLAPVNLGRLEREGLDLGLDWRLSLPAGELSTAAGLVADVAGARPDIAAGPHHQSQRPARGAGQPGKLAVRLAPGRLAAELGRVLDRINCCRSVDRFPDPGADDRQGAGLRAA